MVETRRQSGRLPPPPRDVQASAEFNASEEEYGLESESESESDSGSEWGTNSPRARGKPPTKRVKTTPTSPKVQTRKKRLNLSLLPTMPLDILFEIFGLLSPKDLVNLCRTSKPFRGMLLSRNAVTVWKAARESLFGPTCPRDISESRWAILLFGGANCQECGTGGVQRIDFALRRRICTSCLQENLVFSSKFCKKFPDFDVKIMDLIPHTNTGGWSQGHASSSKFYWEADIYDMAAKLGTFQKDIHMRKPGAKQKLEDFIAKRIKAVKKILKYAEVCRKWSQNMATQRFNDVNACKQKRHEAIKARFLELGYSEFDCLGLGNERGVLVETELTDRIWTRIRRELEPGVLQRKNDRIAAARAALIVSRKRLILPLYQDYKKTLIPDQWPYLPRTYEIYQFPAFKALLHAEDEVQITEASFDDAMVLLPGLITAWTERRKRELTQMILTTNADPAGTPVIPAPNNATVTSIACSSGASSTSQPTLVFTPADSDHYLYLATAVFTCATDNCRNDTSPFVSGFRNVFLAWDAAVAHGCERNFYHHAETRVDTVLEFDKRGSAAAASLVSQAKLDFRSATPADMDKLDLRFVCLDCQPQAYRNAYGRKALSWRLCISHFVASSHPCPTWKLLNPEETSTIKSLEGADPAYNDLSWTCNHCPMHLDHWKNRQDVVQHLRTMHNNIDPKEPADLFYYPGQQRTLRSPAVFAMPRPPKQWAVPAARPGAIYQCKRCQGAARNRMFSDHGVQQHLRDKHKISSPVLGLDWAEK